MTYKQVFIINSDLGMGKGKIGVQTAHGEVFYMQMIMNRKTMGLEYGVYEKWISDENGMMKKVVLKATEKEMLEFIPKLKEDKIWACEVHDKGLTQIPEGSFTCLVIEPLSEEKYDRLFKHLKLL